MKPLYHREKRKGMKPLYHQKMGPVPMVKITLKDGITLTAQANTLDDDGDCIIGKLSDGRNFGFPMNNLSHVVEVR